jgi:alkanesulfonate monooxygenase SsuD/methylene tetrahydromethanopterin reductase-like flavin-dependent oxidoreductase (luciferase family)
LTHFCFRLHVLEPLVQVHAHKRPRIASATSFVLSLWSPAGPTHEGHPFSHEQAQVSSRVRSSSTFEIL